MGSARAVASTISAASSRATTRPCSPPPPSSGRVTAADLERAAEAVWQAESMRASGRPRQVSWKDAADGQQEEFRGHARAAFAAIGLQVEGEQG